MITRVAVVPQPPLLVPELVAGEDPDALRVRAECLAVGAGLAAAARRWVAIAVDAGASDDLDAPTVVGPHAAGTFRGYGVDVRVGLAAGADLPPDPALPLPALVAGWLRAASGAEQVRVWMVPPRLPATDCRGFGERVGAELGGGEPVGLLVIGDGSHRHGERAVGRPDERAAGFDEQVRLALAAADPEALFAVDAEVAAELGAVGRAAWHILSGVMAKDGRSWECTHSRLLIPFGVAYHFAIWDPR